MAAPFLYSDDHQHPAALDQSTARALPRHGGHPCPGAPQWVNPAFSRTRADFRRGFYTTTVEAQAMAWAERLARQLHGTQPAVLRFEVERDALASLDCLWFVRGARNAVEYWAFVMHCRS